MASKWHDFLDRQIAERPGAPALTDSTGAIWSYDDLDAACRDISDLLIRQGLNAGDRVVVLLENCAAAVAAIFACSRLGLPVSPVNARQSGPEIDRILGHARPAAVLCTAHASADARAHAQRLGAHEVTGAFGSLQFASPYSSAPEDLDDVAVILFTTGTTGAPKGVMLTHANMVFGGNTSAAIRGITARDIVYGALPISHVFGLTSLVTASISAGAMIRFEARFTASKLYDALNNGITLFSGVPQMHAILMQYCKEQGHDRLPSSTLRYVSSGAAPLDPAWKRKAEAFYGVALQNGYGMTETTAGVCVTVNTLGDPDISVGPPLPQTDVRIAGEEGEVLVRGPCVMKGYYRNPQATEAALTRDGWLHTGDLGRFDAKGNLHILGRSKELIIHGGFNVYPPEVEAALNDHPQVVQCAVVGRARSGDEEVLAFVQAAPDDMPDPEKLRLFAAERLAGYKRPGQIVITTALPASATGKILKHKLIETFADHLE